MLHEKMDKISENSSSKHYNNTIINHPFGMLDRDQRTILTISSSSSSQQSITNNNNDTRHHNNYNYYSIQNNNITTDKFKLNNYNNNKNKLNNNNYLNYTIYNINSATNNNRSNVKQINSHYVQKIQNNQHQHKNHQEQQEDHQHYHHHQQQQQQQHLLYINFLIFDENEIILEIITTTVLKMPSNELYFNKINNNSNSAISVLKNIKYNEFNNNEEQHYQQQQQQHEQQQQNKKMHKYYASNINDKNVANYYYDYYNNNLNVKEISSEITTTATTKNVNNALKCCTNYDFLWKYRNNSMKNIKNVANENILSNNNFDKSSSSRSKQIIDCSTNEDSILFNRKHNYNDKNTTKRNYLYSAKNNLINFKKMKLSNLLFCILICLSVLVQRTYSKPIKMIANNHHNNMEQDDENYKNKCSRILDSFDKIRQQADIAYNEINGDRLINYLSDTFNSSHEKQRVDWKTTYLLWLYPKGYPNDGKLLYEDYTKPIPVDELPHLRKIDRELLEKELRELFERMNLIAMYAKRIENIIQNEKNAHRKYGSTRNHRSVQNYFRTQAQMADDVLKEVEYAFRQLGVDKPDFDEPIDEVSDKDLKNEVTHWVLTREHLKLLNYVRSAFEEVRKNNCM